MVRFSVFVLQRTEAKVFCTDTMMLFNKLTQIRKVEPTTIDSPPP